MERQKENWKPISGFEDRYFISDKGRVYSHYSKKILSPLKINNGYLQIMLCKNGKEFLKRIHRLVAEHFISNPENYEQINHKNEDKLDNRVENLEWCSRQYNTEYSKSKVYVLYNENDEKVEIFNISKFARDNGLDKQHLHEVAKGKINSHYGYTRKPGTKLQRKGSFRLISPEGEVMTFNNQREAANFVGDYRQNISSLLRGKVKTCRGYRLYPLDGIFAFT